MKRYLFLTILALTVSVPLLTRSQANLARELSGRILLQVEKNGEAWYVNPQDFKRYYLGRPSDALNLMKELGIGITNEQLNKIPLGLINYSDQDSDDDGLSDNFEIAIGTNKNSKDSDLDGYDDKTEVLNDYNPLGQGKFLSDTDFLKSKLGVIFLQTEKNGEAWYVEPISKKRYYLGRPADAFAAMRSFGLGIAEKNIPQISIGYLDLASSSPITDTDSERKIIEATASAIRTNNSELAQSYFTDDIKNIVNYTINFLDDEGRLTLANVLSSSVLTSTAATKKVYTAEVYFNSDKHLIPFTLVRQIDGNWKMANL